MPTLEERLAELRDQFRDMRIIGGRGVAVEGSSRHGFAVNISSDEEEKGRGTGGVTPGVRGCTDPLAVNYNPDATIDDGSCVYAGACCVDGDCSITFSSDCAGDFFVNTECDPNPCPQPTGACCVDNICSVETEDGCFDIGGLYQGNDVPCTPNPCEAPTGACCDGEACSIETEENCVDLIGGSYKGDDVPCFPNPCETGACCTDGACTQVFEEDCAGIFVGGSCAAGSCCPSISMTCDSASASGSKCGFDNAGGKWLTRLRTDSICSPGVTTFGPGPCNDEIGPGPPERRLTWTVNWAISEFFVSTVNPVTCVPTTLPCSAAGSYSWTRNDPEPPCELFEGCTSGSITVGSCAQISCTAFTCSVNIPGCGNIAICNTGSIVSTFTYSDEYTTDLLISTVNGELAYTGSYTSGACASSRFLSFDETTYSVQRSKPRFTFGASLVSFILAYDIVDTSTSSVVGTESFTISAGASSFDGPELLEPATNTTYSIQNIRCIPL